jgi:hypothetical protein
MWFELDRSVIESEINAVETPRLFLSTLRGHLLVNDLVQIEKKIIIHADRLFDIYNTRLWENNETIFVLTFAFTNNRCVNITYIMKEVCDTQHEQLFWQEFARLNQFHFHLVRDLFFLKHKLISLLLIDGELYQHWFDASLSVF